MADELPPPEQLLRQMQQHLQSLQTAGVAWLPISPESVCLSHHPVAGEQPVGQEGLTPTVPQPQAVPQEQVDPLTVRRQELEVLATQVSRCERCKGLASTRTQTVFGVGKLEPELCLIGEAPGADEDAKGEPFVGAAGQLLNRILAACGLKREDLYICNIIKCRPPGNRTPNAEEAANCHEYLDRQLELIQPKYICTLGSTAAKYLLGTSLSLSRLRGRLMSYKGIPVVCTYHPAYLLPHRSPDQQTLMDRKRLVWEDMKLLLAHMGRPIEKK